MERNQSISHIEWQSFKVRMKLDLQQRQSLDKADEALQSKPGTAVTGFEWFLPHFSFHLSHCSGIAGNVQYILNSSHNKQGIIVKH